MKKLLTFFAFIISFHASAINEKQATLVTQNFLIEKNITRASSLSQFSLKEIVKKEDMKTFYIMNLGDNEGFVIVSASQYLPPVFGFSFENAFGWNPAVQAYIDAYSEYILSEEKSKEQPKAHILSEWEAFLQENYQPSRTTAKEVPALITTRWNQNKFYNTYCPWDVEAGAFYDYRVPNGCVALAGAQLMNYYRYPEAGRKTYSYKPSRYPLQVVFASQQRYNWDAMCDSAIRYTNEIAKLAYHLGVAVFMDYAPGGSGAQTERLVHILSDNYSYTNGEPWVIHDTARFKKEIDALRPILMQGCIQPSKDCHAFLVDGYKYAPSIRFNFNWGWGGESNGYFYLDGGHGNQSNIFQENGRSYLNIKPTTNFPAQCQQYKRQTATEGYITNGSTNQPYQSAPDCSWIIAAPGATNYTFSFSRLDTQKDIDIITIYKGGTKSSGVAATFSGSQIPTQNIVVKADSVLITFTSNAPLIKNETHKGFLMSYITNKPPQKCNATTTIKTPSGFITNGTLPEENYSPWTSCTWNIAPDENTGFFGLFREFDLGLGDFVDIYDPATNPPTFMARYDRNTPPVIGEVVRFQKEKIQIRFISDNYDQGKGFKFQYFSVLGVDNNALLDNITIFPNPATDFINISFAPEWGNQSVNCKIVDVIGKEVYSTTIDYQSDTFFTQIPVAHLSHGVYFIHLSTNTQKATSKIIKN